MGARSLNIIDDISLPANLGEAKTCDRKRSEPIAANRALCRCRTLALLGHRQRSASVVSVLRPQRTPGPELIAVWQLGISSRSARVLSGASRKPCPGYLGEERASDVGLCVD